MVPYGTGTGLEGGIVAVKVLNKIRTLNTSCTGLSIVVFWLGFFVFWDIV